MNILVFGTGKSSVGIEYECVLNGYLIVAYLDNDPAKWGTVREGRSIMPPASVAELDFDFVVTASVYHEEMRRQLNELGVSDEKILAARLTPDRWIEGGRHLIHHRHYLASDGSRLLGETLGFEIGPRALEDIPPPIEGPQHDALVKKLWDALLAAEQDADTAPEAYRIGSNWRDFLAETRPEYFEARRRGDIERLGSLLANFCRNDMSTGILGGRAAFEAYSTVPGVSNGIRANFNVWQYSVGAAPVHELASPPVGNPYGHWIEGVIVHPNTFLNHYRGCFARKLLADIPRPVVAEIGGGFGGFAYYALKLIPGCCYLDFDIPENLLIASYFLSLTYPDLRILLYSGREDLQAAMESYDVILTPQYALPWLPERSVDLFVNTISLSEMNYSTICEYLKQITRVCDGFFYHENLIANGTDYQYYPVDVFPRMPDFLELTRQPSRWPFFSASSPHHCHMEQLLVRKDRLRSRTRPHLPTRPFEV